MPRPLRIGFDVAQTCQERAGCGWFADSLAHALAAVEPENEYFLYHQFDRWLNDDTGAGTRINSPRAHGPMLNLTAKDAAELWRKIRTGEIPLPGNPEIVQSNSYQAPPVGSARLVFFVHDLSFWTHPEFSTEENRLHCQNGVFAALQQADGFLFNSESSHSQFDRLLSGWLARSGKLWVVTPLGHREFARSPDPVAESPVDQDAFWLAVGSLEPRKNYETLLDALDLYWTRSPRRIPLRIVGGNGWKSGALKTRLAEAEVQGKARWLGYVSDVDLGGLYAQTQALVFPSWDEGFGLPVLEAMSQGAPVICSHRSSLPEVGGTAAIYVDPANAASICDAMLTLEAEPTRRVECSAAGRHQAAQFGWEKTARATLDFYRRVLAAPAASSS